MQEDLSTRWRIGLALAGAALVLGLSALLAGCGPTANNAAAAPAVQGGSTAAAPLSIPASAWNVSLAWTPTPCAAPCAAATPPAVMTWTATDGRACSWYAATQQITCGP